MFSSIALENVEASQHGDIDMHARLRVPLHPIFSPSSYVLENRTTRWDFLKTFFFVVCVRYVLPPYASYY